MVHWERTEESRLGLSVINRWFPLAHQVMVLDEKSDNFLRSIWIGLTVGTLNLSTNALTLIVAFFKGEVSLFTCGRFLFITLLVMPILGLRNMLDSADITVEEMYSRLERELNGEDF